MKYLKSKDIRRGATDIKNAMDAGYLDFKYATLNHAIYDYRLFLLSDAQPNTGEINGKEIAKFADEIAKQNHIFTTVIGIGVSYNGPQQIAEKLAQIKGAHVISIVTIADYFNMKQLRSLFFFLIFSIFLIFFFVLFTVLFCVRMHRLQTQPSSFHQKKQKQREDNEI